MVYFSYITSTPAVGSMMALHFPWPLPHGPKKAGVPMCAPGLMLKCVPAVPLTGWGCLEERGARLCSLWHGPDLTPLVWRREFGGRNGFRASGGRREKGGLQADLQHMCVHGVSHHNKVKASVAF